MCISYDFSPSSCHFEVPWLPNTMHILHMVCYLTNVWRTNQSESCTPHQPIGHLWDSDRGLTIQGTLMTTIISDIKTCRYIDLLWGDPDSESLWQDGDSDRVFCQYSLGQPGGGWFTLTGVLHTRGCTHKAE